jgi:hypothetical protein
MIKLKKILLTEALADLYHSTSIDSLRKILSGNEIKLTFAGHSEDEMKHQRNQLFFLSTSRMKFGNYARGSGSGNTRGGEFEKKVNVVVHLDGHKLEHNHKIHHVNYYGIDDGPDSEQEDRVVSNRDSIPQASRYIKGIHIYLPENMNRVSRDNELNIHEVDKLAKKLSIPIYFYDSIGAFMQQRTSKAKEFVDQDQVPIPDDDELKRKDPTQGGRITQSYYGEELINIWRERSPKSQTIHRAVYNYLTQPFISGDLQRKIKHELGDWKTKHPPYMRELANAMRKANVKHVDDFIAMVKKKVIDDIDAEDAKY